MKKSPNNDNQYIASIGEMAKLTGLTVPTLRYYDSIDLVKPAVVNEETGYRYYEAGQVNRLDIIRCLRHRFDMSLDDLKTYVADETDDTQRVIMLLEKEAEINRKIQEMMETKRILHKKIEIMQQWNMDSSCEIQEVQLPSIQIYGTEVKPDLALYDALTMLREFMKKDGTYVDDADLVNVFSLNGYQETGHFLFKILGSFNLPSKSLKTIVYPEGKYLKKRFMFSFENYHESMKEFIRYAQEHGYTLSDDVIYTVHTPSLWAFTENKYILDGYVQVIEEASERSSLNE